jgi:hypothetical protein
VIRVHGKAADGRPMIMLGLTRENIRHLVDVGQPILVSGESVGVPDVESVVVWFGETETDLVDVLKESGLMGAGMELQAEAEKEPSRIVVGESLLRPPVVNIGWDSKTEKLAASVDHALLVVPHGPEGHRIFFAANDQQLGDMTATVLSLAKRRRNGVALAIAHKALKEGQPGDFRGEVGKDGPNV